MDLDLVIQQAKQLRQRAEGASLYPASELVVIAVMLEILATKMKVIELKGG